MSHSARANRLSAAAAVDAVAYPLPSAHLIGFGHWPDTPRSDGASAHIRPPLTPETNAKLATLLRGSYPWAAPLIAWDPAHPTVELDDNPEIPSGYTYLLQFVAHDVVQTLTALWAADPATGSANLRTSPLQLMALYGGSPVSAPIAYMPAGDDVTMRTKLQIGSFDTPAATGCPFRDLARVNLRPASVPGDGSNSALVCDPLVADQRNDDNAVLAQLVMLFISLHNAIVDRIVSHGSFAALPDAARGQAIFAVARATLQRIYHAVIRRDLLKRILHPAVYKAYAGCALSLWKGGPLPLEFSCGAMRAGHAMIRNVYFLLDGTQREVSLLRSLDSPRPVPQTSFWAVRWSRFFEMGNGVVPNYSRRIGPGVSALLYDRTQFPPIDIVPGEGSLPYRDLRSADFAGLAPVAALIDAIRRHQPCLIPATWSFADPEARRNTLSAWLATQNTRQSAGLTDPEIAAVANDMPLPLFVLVEAALDPAVEGRHMGLLGSIIVADVLFKLLADAGPVADATIAPHLPPATMQQITAISDMPGCVRFVDGMAFGPTAKPPFI